MKKYIFILTFLFISNLFANTNLVIDDNKNIYDNFKILYLKDETSLLKIDEISKREFSLTTKNKFTLGYTKGSAWFKLSIDNRSLNKNFILSLNESFYEVANLYYFDRMWEKKQNSAFMLIEKREIKHNNLSFNIDLEPNQKQIFYIELKAKYAYFGNISIYKKSDFHFSQELAINSIFVFIFGIFVIVILFNLFLYIQVKEKIYIYYVGYSFFNLIYLIKISGFLVYVGLQKFIYDLQLSAAFMIGFLILFSMEYLEVKRYLSKLYKPLKYLSLLFFTLGLLVVISYQPWNIFINNLSGLVSILLIVISIIIYFKGLDRTKYYIFAMIFFFIFVVLFTFSVAGVFEYSYLNRYGFIIASAIEIIIFSLMLTNRYNVMNKDIQIYLENEVKNRTEILTTVNKELNTLITDRELLLKELYHRVKNNFHLVIGLLWIESDTIKDQKIKNTFLNIITRIKSISTIHQYLYESKILSTIDTENYINKIIEETKIAYSSKSVIFSGNIQHIEIDMDSAMSLGFIINELLTNSIKHNEKNETLIIYLSFTKDKDLLTLILKDNGLGFNEKNISKGLGLKLIKQFSKKLHNSNYEFMNENGFKFILNFKLKNDLL